MAVGPWRHVRAPRALPTWVRCSGYAGLLGVAPVAGAAAAGAAAPALGTARPTDGEEEPFLVIRAVAVSDSRNPSHAVVVDVPVTGTLPERIRETTSIKLGGVTLDDERADAGAPRQDVTTPPLAAQARGPDAAAEETLPRKRRLQWVAFLDYVDWPTGVTRRATMAIEVNIADIYERLSAGQARGQYSVGSAILLILLVLGVLFLIIEAAALVMGLVLARSITGSVHQLFAGTERVRQGDLGHRIEVRTQDQLGELAESFNQMTQSITDLLREAEEKKRLEEELRIARTIQMSLLPRGDLGVPGLSISALCVPAREVGGDYYDVLRVDDGRIGLLVADVSGKGTSAAFYMAELKGLMLSLSRIHRSPRLLLIDANRIISDHLDSRSFITMTYAIIDTTARTMTYARAGHTPLIYRPARPDGDGGVRILTPDGLVLGLRIEGGAQLFERLLREETLALGQGDLLLFFTDGISEAMNEESDCFGEARLGRIVDEHGDLPPDELRERILREIEAFVAGAPQHDDMTMILVKVE